MVQFSNDYIHTKDIDFSMRLDKPYAVVMQYNR